MIKLEEIKQETINNAENNREMLNLVNRAFENQKSLGLGCPVGARNYLLEVYSVDVLLENFKEVKKPNFPVFRKEYSWYDSAIPENKEMSAFPRFAMVELDSTIGKIHAAFDGEHKEALLPLIPISIQELCKRAKDLVPSMKFHIIFMPQWEKKPNPDPVIVGEAGGRFFEIARWDGDAALIAEFMESV